MIAVRYQSIMAQALIRRLHDETLEAYRAAARAKGNSLEAELRETLEANCPARGKDKAALLALSDALLALTPSMTSDSTPFIRRMRDTNGGRWQDDAIDDR